MTVTPTTTGADVGRCRCTRIVELQVVMGTGDKLRLPRWAEIGGTAVHVDTGLPFW